MKKKVILIPEVYKDYIDEYEQCLPDYDIKVAKECFSIPDSKRKGNWIAMLRNGKIVLPNRKRNVTFEKNSNYVLLDYIEKDRYIIANKVFRIPRNYKTKHIFYHNGENVHCMDTIEIGDGVYYYLASYKL